MASSTINALQRFWGDEHLKGILSVEFGVHVPASTPKGVNRKISKGNNFCSVKLSRLHPQKHSPKCQDICKSKVCYRTRWHKLQDILFVDSDHTTCNHPNVRLEWFKHRASPQHTTFWGAVWPCTNEKLTCTSKHWDGEMAPSVKCRPQRHEDLSSERQHPWKVQGRHGGSALP